MRAGFASVSAKIAFVFGRIALADRLRVGVGLDEGEFDSELAEGVGEQRDRSAVEARDGDDVVSGPGDVQYGDIEAVCPALTATAATPPSSAAIFFSNASTVGFASRV